jgi:hypothetical protein
MLKKCKRCHENMRSSYSTCPRCGFCSLEKCDSKSYEDHDDFPIEEKVFLSKKTP